VEERGALAAVVVHCCCTFATLVGKFAAAVVALFEGAHFLPCRVFFPAVNSKLRKSHLLQTNYLK
jgi:hypothetical protein